ncbi:MAG: glycoside hydrolase [Acidobacteriota bacterium]|nr:glycoside hydrolase [Acidobacteriota bacterium]
MAATLACLIQLGLAGSSRGQTASLPDVAVSTAEPGAFRQPALAVDPTDPKRLAIAYAEGRRQDRCMVARSVDGGASWSNETLVGSGGRFAVPPDYPRCLDPNLAYGPDGTVYYLYEVGFGTNPLAQRQGFLSVSRGGGDFEQPRPVDPDGVGADRTDLFSEMAVDPTSGRIYVGFLRYCEPSVPEPRALPACLPDPLKTVVASSGDGGRSFSQPVQSSDSSSTPAQQSVAVDRGGMVYSVWADGFLDPTDSPASINVAVSPDQGATFGPPTQVGQALPCDGDLCYQAGSSRGFFHAVGGASAGKAHVAWWDKQGDKYRVFLTSTADGGQSWSPPRVVGIPPGGEDHEQHRPRLATTPEGRLFIAYYDTSPEGFHDVYLTDSRDGGATFSVPTKLTDVASDARLGAPGSTRGRVLTNYGHRLGLTLVGDRAMAAWTDSRRGNRTDGKQDIFFEAVPAQGAPGTGTGTGAGSGKFTAKLAIARARILRRGRRLDVLAPITRRASGSVRVELQAAGRRTRFSARIDSARGRIRFSKRIPASQADLGTGIVTITYGGDADTRPQVVRLRAASQRAALRLSRPRIVGGRLRASGTVTRRARGVVRVQLEYDSAGRTTTLQRNARISNGRWRLNAQLSSAVRDAIARRQGTVHSYTLFTGYFPRRVRGEMRSFQVLGNP